MANRDSFIFYRSFYECSIPLTKSQKAELFDAICNYGLDQIDIELNPIPKAMFQLIKPQLEANYRKYLSGKKGGRPKQEETKPKPNDNQTITKPKPNVNVNDNVNDNVNEKIGGKRFSPPSINDVKKYITEKGYKVDAERFVNFYASKGWMVGKNKMKDWQAAVRNWSKGDPKEEKSLYTESDVVSYCLKNNITITSSQGKLTGISQGFMDMFKQIEKDGIKYWVKK